MPRPSEEDREGPCREGLSRVGSVRARVSVNDYVQDVYWSTHARKLRGRHIPFHHTDERRNVLAAGFAGGTPSSHQAANYHVAGVFQYGGIPASLSAGSRASRVRMQAAAAAAAYRVRS